ncbi:MAG TPA: hypothetical protein VM305_01660 [Candidatus Limnocylindrales bacterium]|nr:hypothetical protein [Candidatus Limnocylindrales bacterium]
MPPQPAYPSQPQGPPQAYAPPAYATDAPPAPSRSRRRAGGGVLIGLLLGALVGLLLAVGAFALLGGRDGDGPLGAGATFAPGGATVAPGQTTDPAAETQPPAAAADGSYSCETQEARAPEDGAWQLFRASFGTRPDFDYLTLHLRQTGRADDEARLRAELLEPTAVADRYGVAAPPGDTALVVTLDRAVRIPGSFGGRPQHQALREFEVVRGADGAVHVIAGVVGRGCFAMLAEDWQAGSSPRTTEVTLRIERP